MFHTCIYAKFFLSLRLKSKNLPAMKTKLSSHLCMVFLRNFLFFILIFGALTPYAQISDLIYKSVMDPIDAYKG